MEVEGGEHGEGAAERMPGENERMSGGRREERQKGGFNGEPGLKKARVHTRRGRKAFVVACLRRLAGWKERQWAIEVGDPIAEIGGAAKSDESGVGLTPDEKAGVRRVSGKDDDVARRLVSLGGGFEGAPNQIKQGKQRGHRRRIWPKWRMDLQTLLI